VSFVGTRIASALLVVCAALVQVTIGHRIEIGAASPDLLILIVTAIALLTGSISGAAHGFLAGMCIALFAGLPLGPHALVATLAGFAVGRLGEVLVTDEHPIPPLAAGIVATAAMQIGRPLVEFLVNPAVASVDGLWSRAFLTTAISAVLAVPLYLLVRRVLITAHSWSGGTADTANLGEGAA